MPKFATKSGVLIVLLILFSALCDGNLGAQEDRAKERECRKSFEKIKEYFDKGKLPEIERIITDTAEAGFTEKCVKGGVFNKDEERELYEILTETFIFLNKEEDADRYLEKLLHLKPDYIVKTEKPDLNYLYSRFKVDPIFSLEFSFAPSLTLVNVLQRYSIDNTSIINETYTSVPGYSTGVKIALPVSKYFELSGGVHFTLRRYSYEDELVTFPLSLGSLYGSLTYTESQNWLDVPIHARITFPGKRFKPYVFGGFNLNFLFTATLQDLRRLSGNGIEEQQSFSIVSGNTNLRAKSNFSLTGGVGAKYQVGLNYLFAEFGYATMVSNLVNARSRYSNATLLYQIGFVDNDYKMSNVVLRAGFGKSFYNPELRRRYKKELASFKTMKAAERQEKKAQPKKEKQKKKKLKKEDLEEGKGKVEEGKGKAEEGIEKLKGFQ